MKLKFSKYNLPRQQLNNIIERVRNELKWYPEENNDGFIVAKKDPSFISGSCGEKVTILFDTNRVLITKICDPDKRSSVVSVGQNKNNMMKLIKEIQNASY